MKLLLDTHIFLWFISGDKHLPEAMCDDVRNPDNVVYLSVVSLWETIIKHQLGKLPLPHPPAEFLPLRGEGNSLHSREINRVEHSFGQLFDIEYCSN